MADAADAKRIAVVTGASRGIGRAAALELAKTGHHVIAIARTQGALEELDDEITSAGGSATLAPLDITDGDALNRLGLSLYERYGRVDVLVGNAGVLGPLSPLSHVDPKRWDEVMRVNVDANWRLVRSLDPLLRQSPAGRAVFVTSGAAHKCRAYWGPYAVSKAALEVMIRTYAAETVTTSNVRVNLLNPGPLRTRMRAQAMPGEDAMTLKTPEDLAPFLVETVLPSQTRSGLIYDFPTDDWLVPQMPLPEA
ncbi:SDR family NAD(P)-dependent oxidoreductase [Methylobrevis pamukkalensis]|uniref:Putative oxidoreductase YciK n=1 Tax=Methylobrevis pamukkalensis TaxID=1439726 RepID=A0A1E3H1Y4_9HYPH|nr:SDR family NAD(P)-dependent oxidoreductase [Methylobrevis pamukkalensis]ODN70320.1 putative oxidoreductase YciK [Methylobrevis pamukkalensis]